MSLLETLSAQPRFPHEDLTDTNASLVELLIANSALRETMHEATEAVSLPSQVGHVSILSIVRDEYEQARRVDAIDHGVRSFEAIKAIVAAGSSTSTPDISATNRALMLLRSANYERYLDEAVSSFADTMPRTREVIHISSRSTCGYFTDYALLGAALAWQFEKDAA